MSTLAQDAGVESDSDASYDELESLYHVANARQEQLRRDHAPMQLDQLPKELFVRLLQHVGQHERLRNCALVSASWQHTTTAATSRIKHTSRGPDNFTWLINWLKKHGREVRNLELSLPQQVCLRALPCSNLHELQVSGGSLQLEPGDGYHGVLHDCGRLTHLALKHCSVLSDCCTSLPSLTRLRHLSFEGVTSTGKPNKSGVGLLPNGLLSELVKLTHFHLTASSTTSCSQASSVLQHVSCLRVLEVLRLGSVSRADLPGLQALQELEHLSQLELSAAPLVHICTDNTPWLNKLTALQCLSLQLCQGVEAAAFAGLTQLQYLELRSTHITDGDQEGVAGIAALMTLLPSLQQLQSLSLSGSLEMCVPAAAYASLTASTKLQVLNISKCVLPVDGLQHIFAVERLHQNLQELSLNGLELESADGSRQRLEAHHFAGIARCCPQLRQVSLCGSLQQGTKSSCLLQLSGLQSVHIDRVDNATFEGLPRLTGLRSLTLDCGSLSMNSVVQLTSLKQLTHLRLNGCILDGCQKAPVSFDMNFDQQVSSEDQRFAQLLQYFEFYQPSSVHCTAQRQP